MCALGIELVVTAHPTEIMRRTLQHKYRRIADALAELDRTDVTCLERETSVETLRREITAAWETEEVRRERPSPLDEVRSALAVFEQTLWDALPQYCARSIARCGSARAAACRSTRRRSASAPGLAAIATAIRTSRPKSRAAPA